VSKVNIQDQLLYQARKEHCPVKIYLISGLRLMGTIAAYDMYSVLLESQDRLQLIFKHAISTLEFPEQIRLGHESSAKGGATRVRPGEPAPDGPPQPAGPPPAGKNA
jgi:host factor-I protein